jgi:hypothetical protein
MKNVIINIRGTYGSGKTVLARRIMSLYGDPTAHMVEGRKKPLYYTFEHPEGGNPLAVVGSYETVCGGCDTIPNPPMIFETVDFLQLQGFDVLYESLLLTADVGRTKQYFVGNHWPLNILALATPTEVCIASVNKRREARGQMEPVNPKNLLIKVAGVKSSCKSLAAAGVPIFWVDRDAALIKALDLLNITHCL